MAQTIRWIGDVLGIVCFAAGLLELLNGTGDHIDGFGFAVLASVFFICIGRVISYILEGLVKSE
jgi:hypothetical protein